MRRLRSVSEAECYARCYGPGEAVRIARVTRRRSYARLSGDELRPGAIAFVGKEAYRGAFGERPQLGLQERRLGETLLFVVPSTSPANAAVGWEERLGWFRELRRLLA